MHKALQLPDILANILGHSDKQSIGRATVVCKAWSETANAVLWKNVSCLWTLMQILGPLTNRHQFGSNERAYIFARAFGPKDWDRFLQCAQRVKEIDYDPANKGHRPLGSELFMIVAATRPTIELAPNLRRLFWVIEDDISFAHALLFCTPRLESLHLVLAQAIAVETFRSFLEDLPNRCPNLLKLKLDFDMSMSALEPTFSEMLSAMPTIQELGVPAYCVTSSVMRALSKHRRLRMISSKPVWGNHFLGSADDVKSLDLSDLPHDSFPELKDLEIDTGLLTSTNLLASSCIPRSLTRLFISSFEEEPIVNLRNMVAFIAAEFHNLKYLGITYLVRPTDENPPITQRVDFEVLRPALKMRKLTHFLFMHNLPLLYTEADIADMGAAWGDGPLRHLRLVPDPVYSPNGSLETDLRLGTLQTFARHLPKLEHLEVYIDATKDIPTTPPSSTFNVLHTLDIGISPITDSDQGPVARWLAQLVPRHLTIAYQAGWALSWAQINSVVDNETLFPRRKIWQRVGELHTQLYLASIEQTKRIQTLAEEVSSRDAEIKKLQEQLRVLKLAQSATLVVL